jgi:hypothetical protein
MEGGAGGRPLVAPRACAIAGELEALTPFELLTNATKLANLLGRLVRGARLDVAWVESGSNLACEVAGRTLDWSTFPPRVGARASPPGPAAMASGRGAVAVEATRRLNSVLGEAAVVGVALPGPVELAARLPEMDQEDAVDLLLSMVRWFTEAGAGLVLLSETGPARRPEDHASLMRPLTTTARFHGALPILAVPPGWRHRADLGKPIEGAIYCFGVDEVAAQSLPGQLALATPLPVPPNAVIPQGCVLLTTVDEITGLLPASSLGAIASSLLTLARPGSAR